MQSYKNKIIAGDLNIDTSTSSFEQNHFLSLLKDNSLYRVPFGSTHFTANSCSSIDHIITDSQAKVID